MTGCRPLPTDCQLHDQTLDALRTLTRQVLTGARALLDCAELHLVLDGPPARQSVHEPADNSATPSQAELTWVRRQLDLPDSAHVQLIALPEGPGGWLCVVGSAQHPPLTAANLAQLDALQPFLQATARALRQLAETRAQVAQAAHPGHGISRRELQVGRLLLDGHAAVNIAAILELSETTVRTYIRRLYRKLSVCNRTDFVHGMQRLLPAAGALALER